MDLQLESPLYCNTGDGQVGGSWKKPWGGQRGAPRVSCPLLQQ